MGETTRTYGELDDRARHLASVLSELGAGPGRPVATVLPNGIEIFEVAMAAAMLDAPYLPVNWHLKADELAYILDDADVSVVVGQAGLDEDVKRALGHQPPAPCWWGTTTRRDRVRGPPWPVGTAGRDRS